MANLEILCTSRAPPELLGNPLLEASLHTTSDREGFKKGERQPRRRNEKGGIINLSFGKSTWSKRPGIPKPDTSGAPRGMILWFRDRHQEKLDFLCSSCQIPAHSVGDRLKDGMSWAGLCLLPRKAQIPRSRVVPKPLGEALQTVRGVVIMLIIQPLGMTEGMMGVGLG